MLSIHAQSLYTPPRISFNKRTSEVTSGGLWGLVMWAGHVGWSCGPVMWACCAFFGRRELINVFVSVPKHWVCILSVRIACARARRILLTSVLMMECACEFWPHPTTQP